MGCCISAGTRPSEADAPPAEEETVKEVLMETVPVPLVQNHKGADGVGVGVANEGIKGMPELNLGRTMVEGGSTAEIRCDSEKENGEIVSEVSEICSYSESYSNATAAEERQDDEEDGVVNQRPPVKKRRVPTGGRGRGRGRGQGRRAIAAAPEKRGQVAPLRPPRGRPITAAGQPQPRNAVQLENGRRGEGSGSGGRGGEGFVAPRRELGAGANEVVPAEEAESLENPIVSLECFIFL